MSAQQSPIPSHVEEQVLDSGPRDNPSGAPEVVFSGVLAGPFDTSWVRVLFAGANLPAGSFLRITSLVDYDAQTLNARHLQEWKSASCFFNGWGVLVELVAGPGTKGNWFRVERFIAGDQFRAGAVVELWRDGAFGEVFVPPT